MPSKSAYSNRLSGHLGLANMRQRAELLGADLEIDSEPGHGTTVRLKVPLDPAAWPT